MLPQAHDGGAANVRASVLDGLEYLLGCPMALAPLQALLPTLAPLLHDKSEKVRLSFIKLMQRVNTMRDMHWYDLVSQEQMLARLALDGHRPNLASRITQLLLRSYFPQDARGLEQYKRAVKLLQTAPAAGMTFFAHVHEHVPVANVAKLILILQKGSTLALRRMCNDDSVDSTESTGKPVNVELTARVHKCIAVLWHSIAGELEKPVHASSREALVEAYSGSQILDVLDALSAKNTSSGGATPVPDEDISAPLFEIASMLPAEAVTGLTKVCVYVFVRVPCAACPCLVRLSCSCARPWVVCLTFVRRHCGRS